MKLDPTPEQAEWLRRMTPPATERPKKAEAPKPVPQQVLTDAEIAWLWPRFQKCRVQTYSFAHSFQKTAPERLTPRGKAVVHSIAYTYRRQIFAESAKWTESEFVAAVRGKASQPQKP